MVSQVPVDTMVIKMKSMICLRLKKFLKRVLVKYTNPVKPRMMIDAGPFVSMDNPVEMPAISSHLKDAPLLNLFSLAFINPNKPNAIKKLNHGSIIPDLKYKCGRIVHP